MATSTGYSGLFNGHYGENYETINSRAVRKQFRGVFRGKRGRRFAALLAAVTGTAAGATATGTQTRVAAHTPFGDDLGGVRPAETETLINRVTTSGDIAAIDADIIMSPQPTTYPEDASGVGGGGKLGY